MGGGSEFEWMDVEDLEALAAYIFQICDVVTYGISLDKERGVLDKEYSELDQLLASLGDSLPFVVSKSAAHVTAVHRLRQLASRYKELELTTYGFLEAGRRFADGFIGVLLIPSPFPHTEGNRPAALVDALRRKSPSIQQALSLAVQKMKHIAQQIMATSAAHRAVSRDMDLIVSGAADVLEDPLKCDIGLKAAPALGAAAGGSLGLIIARGALGPVAALALGALGALGASEIRDNAVVPHVKVAFERLYDESQQVSSLIDSKASALAVIAGDLMASSVMLEQMMDIAKHPGTVAAPQLSPRAEKLNKILSNLLLRSNGCQERLTAFRALTYTLTPKKQMWPKWSEGGRRKEVELEGKTL